MKRPWPDRGRRKSAPFPNESWHPHGESGVALLLVLVCLALFLAVAAALVAMTSIDTRIAGAERARHAARGAAEAVLERTLQELAIAADWNEILAGAVQSGFAGTGTAPVAGDWGALDLAALTDRLQDEADDENRWGADRQVWRLFAYGPLDGLLSLGGAGAGADSLYTVAWVADDPGDGDGNPSADANRVVAIRAEAFGPFRSRQTLLATVRRHGGSLELLSWREPAGS